MQWFNNLKIGSRLGASFAFLLVMLALVASFGISRMADTKGAFDQVVNERNVKIALANKAMLDLNVIARSLHNVILFSDPKEQAEMKNRIAEARKRYDDGSDQLKSLIKSETGKKLLADIETKRDTTRPLLAKVAELAEAGKAKEAAAFLQSDVKVPQDEWFKALQAMVEFQEADNRGMVEKAEHDYESAFRTMVGLTLAALVLGIAAAIGITRAIARPIANVLEASRNMVAASEQISATAQALSQGAAEQSASVEETSASMEQMSASISQNNENAKVTGDIATRTARETVEGGQAVRETVTAMQQIAHKISIIDDIAYQTNLLALNAAIEAGRGARQRLRGGGGGSAQAGRAQPGGGGGDQPVGQSQRPAGGTGRNPSGSHRSQHPEDRRPGPGNFRRLQRAELRGGPDQCCHQPDQPGRPAECRRLGRTGLHLRGDERPGPGTPGHDDHLHPGRRDRASGPAPAHPFPPDPGQPPSAGPEPIPAPGRQRHEGGRLHPVLNNQGREAGANRSLPMVFLMESRWMVKIAVRM